MPRGVGIRNDSVDADSEDEYSNESIRDKLLSSSKNSSSTLSPNAWVYAGAASLAVVIIVIITVSALLVTGNLLQIKLLIFQGIICVCDINQELHMF